MLLCVNVWCETGDSISNKTCDHKVHFAKQKATQDDGFLISKQKSIGCQVHGLSMRAEADFGRRGKIQMTRPSIIYTHFFQSRVTGVCWSLSQLSVWPKRRGTPCYRARNIDQQPNLELPISLTNTFLHCGRKPYPVQRHKHRKPMQNSTQDGSRFVFHSLEQHRQQMPTTGCQLIKFLLQDMNKTILWATLE